MAGNSGSKAKVLAINDILREYTDEDHPITATTIADMLKNCGLSAERKAIYSDIDMLIDYGYDIIKNPPPAKGYYLGERDFQIAEARLLIDALQSAQSITEKKTEEIIESVEKSLSKYQRDTLHRQQVYVEHKNKSSNEMLYYWIDALSTAIQTKKKVCIHYIKRRLIAGEEPKNEEHIYNVTPYALIWNDGHYYLVCNNAKYPNAMHLRIDKITKVKILDEPARPLSEVFKYKDHFDAADYLSTQFNMFSGTPERVQIRCKTGMWEIVADRFGEDVAIIEHTEDTFTIAVNAVVSGLVSWIMQYGDSMVALAPQSFRDQVEERAKALVKAYKE